MFSPGKIRSRKEGLLLYTMKKSAQDLIFILDEGGNFLFVDGLVELDSGPCFPVSGMYCRVFLIIAFIQERMSFIHVSKLKPPELTNIPLIGNSFGVGIF